MNYTYLVSIIPFYHEILQKARLKYEKTHMYMQKKCIITFIKVIISQAQHYPHTYDFVGPTANKKKLPLMTRLAEEDRLWKLLLLAVKT
jgi:hypothetical protein